MTSEISSRQVFVAVSPGRNFIQRYQNQCGVLSKSKNEEHRAYAGIENNLAKSRSEKETV